MHFYANNINYVTLLPKITEERPLPSLSLLFEDAPQLFLAILENTIAFWQVFCYVVGVYAEDVDISYRHTNL